MLGLKVSFGASSLLLILLSPVASPLSGLLWLFSTVITLLGSVNSCLVLLARLFAPFGRRPWLALPLCCSFPRIALAPPSPPSLLVWLALPYPMVCWASLSLWLVLYASMCRLCYLLAFKLCCCATVAKMMWLLVFPLLVVTAKRRTV